MPTSPGQVRACQHQRFLVLPSPPSLQPPQIERFPQDSSPEPPRPAFFTSVRRPS